MVSPRGWVLLATDTGVGKTTLGAALAAELTQRGTRVAVRKPVETGCIERNGERHPADGAALWQAAGEIEPLKTVCPLRFAAPLAAPEAARQEGCRLDLVNDLLPHLPPQSSSRADVWLVETAGGLCSPVAEQALNLDLAAATGLPVILIAPDRLGSLSALFSALMILAARRLPLAAVVLNQSAPPTANAPDNLSALRHWLPQLSPDAAPAIVHIPWQAAQAGAVLWRALDSPTSRNG
ncbi:dethiobiotin synthase [Halothiobacillus sp. DCM-1]|uniref:dethiobiotin synthase n=1 Tax=Halothiobacillus sp. DCM-1 TaxID=3112558 RepID=UPI003254EADC